jgi:hypothetical protein
MQWAMDCRFNNSHVILVIPLRTESVNGANVNRVSEIEKKNEIGVRVRFENEASTNTNLNLDLPAECNLIFIYLALILVDIIYPPSDT